MAFVSAISASVACKVAMFFSLIAVKDLISASVLASVARTASCSAIAWFLSPCIVLACSTVSILRPTATFKSASNSALLATTNALNSASSCLYPARTIACIPWYATKATTTACMALTILLICSKGKSPLPDVMNPVAFWMPVVTISKTPFNGIDDFWNERTKPSQADWSILIEPATLFTIVSPIDAVVSAFAPSRILSRSSRIWSACWISVMNCVPPLGPIIFIPLPGSRLFISFNAATKSSSDLTFCIPSILPCATLVKMFLNEVIAVDASIPIFFRVPNKANVSSICKFIEWAIGPNVARLSAIERKSNAERIVAAAIAPVNLPTSFW